MKKLYIIFPVIILNLLFNIACSNDEIESPNDKVSPIESTELSMLERISLLENYEIPESKILNIVSKFASSVLEESELRSISNNVDYQIDEKFYFSEAQPTLRTTKNGDDNEQLPVYKVRMSKNGENGYALVSADARHARVIAFIPNTGVDSDDKTDNLGLNIGAREIQKASLISALQRIKKFNTIKDSLVQSAKYKLQLATLSLRSIQTPDYDLEWLDEYPQYVVERTEKRFPLIKTKWNQGVPYNCKLPQDCPLRPEGRYLTGCGIVAITQAISHCEPKLNIYAYNMDWANIKKTATLSKGVTPKAILDQVGMLMKWTGETAKSKYDCTEGTSTGVNAIEDILPKVGMRCDGGRGWDWNIIAASLKNGKIVHVSAACDEGGHGWLMDAYIHTNVGNEQVIYVHHNFGWGGSWDGYYEVENSLEFTANGGQVYDTKFRIQANISKI
jgi:hypothetical protein